MRVSLTGEDVRLVINSRDTVAQVFWFHGCKEKPYFLGETKTPRAGGDWWAWDPALVLWRKAVRYFLTTRETSIFYPLLVKVTSKHWVTQECRLAMSSSASSTLSSLTSSRPEPIDCRLRKARLDLWSLWSHMSYQILSKCGLRHLYQTWNQLHPVRTQHLKFASSSQFAVGSQFLRELSILVRLTINYSQILWSLRPRCLYLAKESYSRYIRHTIVKYLFTVCNLCM